MEKNALFVFEVKEGKRKDQLGEAQLAHLRDVQRDIVGDMVLGQFANPAAPDAGQVLRELYNDISQMPATGGIPGVNNPFFPGNQVGYMPQITTIPDGAFMTATAIVSADRRFVRITPSPQFTQLGDVTTFNFVDGTQGGGGGGGIGGGGGGIGGGGGGIGGGGGGIGGGGGGLGGGFGN